MRLPTGVFQVVTHLVAVVASFLLVLVVTALLPFGLDSVVLLGLLVVVGLVAGGVLEGPAVRLVAHASGPTNSELQVLSTIPDLFERHRVLVTRSAAGLPAPVVIMGPFTVISGALVEALSHGWVSTQEVTALVVHARAHHQVAAPRGEVALAVAEAPVRRVVGGFRGVRRAFAWMPLGSVAWRWRGVVGLVCLVQSVAESRPWPGVLGAGLIVLTYLVPAASRAIEARATAAGDAAVVAAGLGRVLVEVLGRSGRRLSWERCERLQASPRSVPSTAMRSTREAPVRHLQLVRS